MVAATRHDQFVKQDYQRLRHVGIRTVREGVRWHVIENRAGVCSFSGVLPFVREADEQEITIIWDLLHFGWPAHRDVFDPAWPMRFAEFALAFRRFLQRTSTAKVWIAPVNEISFLSWAGGDVGTLNPFATGRDAELKRQLVKGGIAAARAIRDEFPDTRFMWPDPVIHITGDIPEIEHYRLGMFEAWDMLAGFQQPELNGDLDLIDVIGVNFYERNQWRNQGSTIFRGEPGYRPLREILSEVFGRYRKPLVISETGKEGTGRAEWLAYVFEEVNAALVAGVPVEGVCWYPILNHPGWDDDRHCHNGLWDYPNVFGERELYVPLAREIKKIQVRIGASCPMSETELQVVLPDLICLSHLRWEGVFQRPQHLMSRFSSRQRVFFIEEPLFGATAAELVVRRCHHSAVNIVTPHLPDTPRQVSSQVISGLLENLFQTEGICAPHAWFYTPMALEWLPKSCHPSVIAYDCMDELSQFRGAPPELTINETILFKHADVVFTGGRSLYEAKRHKHPNVHAFPSSVDVTHFKMARAVPDSQPDQKELPHPRIGFAGVIDERMNLDLVRELVHLRPTYQFVFLGPVVKITPDALPQASNLHWLGLKNYNDLPSYFAGWDIAMMPFALNESTQFISPTKTPEYLAAGLPVISTSIQDVVNPYGKLGLVRIADTAQEFAVAIDSLLQQGLSDDWKSLVKVYVETLSWDTTWEAIAALLKPAPSMPQFQNSISEERIATHV